MTAMEKVAAKTGLRVVEVTKRTAAMVEAGFVRITFDVDGRATYQVTEAGKAVDSGRLDEIVDEILRKR